MFEQLKLITKNYIVFSLAFLTAFTAASIFAPIESSSATTCTNGSPGNTEKICSASPSNMNVSVIYNPVEYYVNVSSASSSSGSSISLNYPAGENLGNVISASDTVLTKTNSPLPHSLFLSTTSGSNSLNNANAKINITAGGGKTLDTAMALNDNTWGFALPSGTSGIPTNSFNPSYTEATNNSTFSSVPTSDDEILIQQETGTLNEETKEYESTADVYYGVKATSAIPSGTYTNTIRYTALAEAPDQLYVYPNILDYDSVEDLDNLDRNILIYTALTSTQSAITEETATVEFYTINEETGTETIAGTCADPTLSLTDNNYIKVNCEAPELDAGNYGIKVTFTNYARVVQINNIFTYTGTRIITCENLAVGDKAVIGGYEVQKLADNRCWMTGSYKSGVTWYDRGSCPDGFNFPDRTIFNSLLSAVGSDGQLYQFGWSGIYWSSTESGSDSAYYLLSGRFGAYITAAGKSSGDASYHTKCYSS